MPTHDANGRDLDPADLGLLSPAWAGRPIASVTGDAAVLRAMLRFETALATVTAPDGVSQRIADAGEGLSVGDLAASARSGGNPVIPMLDELKARLSADDAAWLHRGATSQDTLDTALVLVTREAVDIIAGDASAAVEALVAHAERHRDTIIVGRTLTQAATPTTIGLKLAGWAWSVARATRALRGASGDLPVQLGGAAGTLAGIVAQHGEGEGAVLVNRVASELGLSAPPAPWHVARSPLTRVADALVEVSDGFGTVGANVAMLARSEIGELDDGAGGGSSAMPHKSNPTRAVLLNATARQAPPLAAQLHAAAATVDERPDGAWHAEWQTLRQLLRTVGGSAATGLELARELRVHEERIAANLAAASDDVLSERARYVTGPATPGDYLGDARIFTDRLLAAIREGAS